MFLKPKKIVFESLITKIRIKDLKPNQINNNKEFVNTLKDDINKNGLLCPLVIDKNNFLLDGHHRYWAIKDFCSQTLVYMVRDKDMDKFLSKLNSYIWFDQKGTLDGDS